MIHIIILVLFFLSARSMFRIALGKKKKRKYEAMQFVAFISGLFLMAKFL